MVSWTRIGPAEPENSNEPDYTPWVLTRDIESDRYFHRNDEDTRGVGHCSWDQLENQELAGPIGDALDEMIRTAGVEGEHHKQWLLDRLVRILTEAPLTPQVNYHTADGTPYEFLDYGDGPGYLEWVARFEGRHDDDDESYYEWDRGIAP